MALEDQMAAEEQQPTNESNLTDAEEQDLEIALLLGERLLEDGGFDVMEKAIDTSSDPAQVIGQFFVQLIQKLSEDFPKDMALSPRIYLAQGGWLEQMMDRVIDELDLDLKVADKAEIYVAQMAKELGAANAQKQQAPVDPNQAAPTMPMQGGA